MCGCYLTFYQNRFKTIYLENEKCIDHDIPCIYPCADRDFYPMKVVGGSCIFVSIGNDNDD